MSYLGYAVGHLPAPRSATRQAGGPHLAPGEPAAESACALHADRRDSFVDVVQFRFAQTLTRPLPWREEKGREAIRRLNPAIPSYTLIILRDSTGAGQPKLLSGESSVAGATASMGAIV